jgi:tetratricopeptide (TPR) repeat protein
MVRKNVSISLVCLWFVWLQTNGECSVIHFYKDEGLSAPKRVELLYQYVTGMWPADEIWPHMHAAMINIADGNEAATQASIDKLRTDFSDNQYLPMALHEIGKLCRLLGNREKSLELNQLVVDTFPSHEYAMWSLREVVLLNIELGNIEGAQAATNNVLNSFANQKYIDLLTHEIAEHYYKFGIYEQAQQLFQYIIDHWPQGYYAGLSQARQEEINKVLSGWTLTQTQIDAQRDMAMVYINNDRMDDAQTIINQLKADCANDPRGAAALLNIGLYCQQLNKYDKAIELHQYVANSWPQHTMAMWSQSCLAICYTGFSNMEAAEAATQKLLADFPQNEFIAQAVYDIARQYYQCGKHEKAKQYYQYVLDRYPQNKDIMWVKIGLAQSNIGLGNNESAENILDILAAELASHSSNDSNSSAVSRMSQV